MGQIENYLDSEGRVFAWPSRKRREAQLDVLRYIAGRFELDRDYTEKEVNAVILDTILISDYCLVRRELFEAGLIGRLRDGRRYWRTMPASDESQ